MRFKLSILALIIALIYIGTLANAQALYPSYPFNNCTMLNSGVSRAYLNNSLVSPNIYQNTNQSTLVLTTDYNIGFTKVSFAPPAPISLVGYLSNNITQALNFSLNETVNSTLYLPELFGNMQDNNGNSSTTMFIPSNFYFSYNWSGGLLAQPPIFTCYWISNSGSSNSGGNTYYFLNLSSNNISMLESIIAIIIALIFALVYVFKDKGKEKVSLFDTIFKDICLFGFLLFIMIALYTNYNLSATHTVITSYYNATLGHNQTNASTVYNYTPSTVLDYVGNSWGYVLGAIFVLWMVKLGIDIYEFIKK